MTVENGGNGGRLESLDALRGFDMIWITGLSGLVATIGLQLPGGEASWLFRQMCHVEWNGRHFIDTIYPLFIFIAGISFPFSFARQRERGDSSLRMHLKVLKRAALLVVLGLVYNGSLNGEAWPFRWASVLGRIGLTWMLAAFVYMHTGVRTRLLLVAALLAGYWAVLLNCVSPLAPAGASPLSLEGCFMGFLDTFLTPGTFWEKGIFEPSGVPMSVVSVGTALLGMTAGDIVRAARWTPGRKAAVLLCAGIVLLAAGLCVSLSVPVNKKLWTPSYTLCVGGYSFLVFALFYWLIDVRGLRGWATPFTWVGMNAIALYMMQALVPMGAVSMRLTGWFAALVPTAAHDVVIVAGHVSLTLLAAAFLYRHKVFFKV